MTDEEIVNAVRQATSEALGLGVAEVKPESTLMDELGAESIDLLDILFRLERKIGVKIKAADVSAYVQGDVPQGGFGDDDGIVTPAAVAQLKRIMPQVDFDAIAATLESEKVMMLFTVANLAELVKSRAATPAA